jgi:hypothetical protein
MSLLLTSVAAAAMQQGLARGVGYDGRMHAGGKEGACIALIGIAGKRRTIGNTRRHFTAIGAAAAAALGIRRRCDRR